MAPERPPPNFLSKLSRVICLVRLPGVQFPEKATTMSEKQLILMVGPQGSGKTTYCEARLKGYLRVSQDDQGKDHIKILENALKAGEPRIVVDRINFDRWQRGRYLRAAKRQGYATKILWLNEDKEECAKRCRERRKHPTLKVENVDRALSMYCLLYTSPSPRDS